MPAKMRPARVWKMVVSDGVDSNFKLSPGRDCRYRRYRFSASSAPKFNGLQLGRFRTEPGFRHETEHIFRPLTQFVESFCPPGPPCGPLWCLSRSSTSKRDLVIETIRWDDFRSLRSHDAQIISVRIPPCQLSFRLIAGLLRRLGELSTVEKTRQCSCIGASHFKTLSRSQLITSARRGRRCNDLDRQEIAPWRLFLPT
jgi:hypothetical protein